MPSTGRRAAGERSRVAPAAFVYGRAMAEPARDGVSPKLILIGAAVALVLGLGLFAALVLQGEEGAPIAPEPWPSSAPSMAPSTASSPATASPDAGATAPTDAGPTTSSATMAPSVHAAEVGRTAATPTVAVPDAAASSRAAGRATAGSPDALDDDDDDDDRQGHTQVYAPDALGIRAAMNEARPLVAECYEGWVRAHPDLAGRLTVTFTIADPTPGSAADDADEARITKVALAASTLDHALLEGCVLNVVSGLRFDRPEDGSLTVSYPFVFATDAPRTAR